MSSLVTNLNSSTAQEIVNGVTTADGCVYTAKTSQVDFAAGKFVQLVETVAKYRVGQKKVNPKCSTHNFVKYWPILKILSLL